MKKYFMNLKWESPNNPILHIKDFQNNNDEYISVPNEFNMRLLDQKVCLGTINPYTREYFSCNNLVEKREIQCNSCKYKFDFYKCVMCHGDKCFVKNGDVLKYCNTYHYVYLAYFFGNKVKVGTASEFRKNDRLLEQGAIFSIYIAKSPTGKIARMIEKSIMDLGISGVVTISYKMKNIIDLGYSYDEIELCLEKIWCDVISRISDQFKQYMIVPEIVYYSEIEKNIQKNMVQVNEQMSLFEEQKRKKVEYSVIKDFSLIKGKYLFSIGKILALERNGLIYLLDTKKIEGFLFDFKNLD